MKILAIETSCDDTCVAILNVKENKFPRFQILSNIVSSQVKLHSKYGGVWPFLAKREHQKNLPIVFKKSLKKAKNPKINLIAVTVGPGLEPCLWQGINFAKDLAKKLNLPIVPVNHIEAHILANWLRPIGENPKSQIRPQPIFNGLGRPAPPFLKRAGLWRNLKQIQNSKLKTQKLFPAICLVVSGGHTQLILMKGIGKYKLIGETRDDAAGECFDKTARILGLGYPGGPAIAKQAAKAKFSISNFQFSIKLPRPMIYQKNYDFSFSGLKTAVLYNFQSQPKEIRRSKKYLRAMAAEIQQAIIDVLIHKTTKAAKDYQAKTIILGGGVAANAKLRQQFKEVCLKLDLNFLVPPKNLCTDNAAMVAVAGYFNRKKAIKSETIEANANLRLE